MDDKTKKIVVGCSILAVGGISLGIILYHCRKPKEALGFDELEDLKMPKLPKSRWRSIESKLDKDLDNFDNRNRRRSMFTVYDKSETEKRFKVLKTVEDAPREKGRLRVSGNIYRKDTPSGYNKNNRNANFTDLGIF